MAENKGKLIVLSQKKSDDTFEITEEPLFGFFTARTFKLKTGLPFNIEAIIGAQFTYSDKQMNLEDVLSFTEYFPTGDERAFLVCIEDTHKRRAYYWLRFVTSMKFMPVDELNEKDEVLKDQTLLEVMKKLFAKFYESVLVLSAPIIESRAYTYYDIVYTIKRDGTRVDGYETYKYEPNLTHSVTKIMVDGEPLQIEGDVRYVKYFTFFYRYHDLTTPLLLETFDYGIGDAPPEYNYYNASTPTSLRWVPIRCATKLTHPKCSNDLAMLLNDIVRGYKDMPLRIDLIQKGLFNGQAVTRKFSGVALNVEMWIQGHTVSYTYWSTISRSFFIEGLYLNGVKLDIDVSSRDVFGLYVFFNPKDSGKLVLICLGLHTESSGSEHRYLWFEPVEIGGKRWLPSVFRAKPDEDTQKIEEKIKSFYGVKRVEEPKGSRMVYFLLFLTGGIIGVLLGVKYARQILLHLRRAYNRAYRQFR